MSFRTWLLTGTSVALLALSPISSARAQDITNPDLVAAFQAYQADPSQPNTKRLRKACEDAGFKDIKQCLQALQDAAANGTLPAAAAPQSESQPAPQEQAAPQEQPAPAPSSEAAPPPPPQEQPAPPPSSQAAPTPPPSSEAAPAAQSDSSDVFAQLQSLVADYNDAVGALASGNKGAQKTIDRDRQRIDSLCRKAGFDDTDSCLAQAGLSLDPLPAGPKAAPPPPPSSAPAPAPQTAAPPPSSEAAPSPSSAPTAQAASEQPAPVQVPRQLEAAVRDYNKATKALASGKGGAQGDFDKANAQLLKVCQNLGFSDIDACAAQFGLTLNPPPSSGPRDEASSVPPVSELPQASEEVTPSAVEVLPPDVSQEAAPILDSAKDQTGTGSSSLPPSQGASSSVEPSAPPPPQQPAGPPPKTDQAAQADIKAPPKSELSTQTEKGKPKPPDFQFVKPKPPEGNPEVKVVDTPKSDNGGVVFQIGINLYISNPLQDRNRVYDPDRGDRVYYEDLSFGRTRETIVRPDGTKVVTIYSRNGDVLKRSKILPNGREIIIASADPREQDHDDWHDPGRNLPPLVLNIPARDYVLDADNADENDVEFFLDQPPVEKVQQIYTIDDVKRSARLRDMVRRLEVGDLTFDTGKATISRDQVGALATVARAMLQLLDKNPGEVFLIEGHTDAVGSDVANLVLSDQRAATVARILTDFYHIPPENLVTQGYGERYLKVKTDGPEPLNRRVTIKRITPLVSYDR